MGSPKPPPAPSRTPADGQRLGGLHGGVRMLLNRRRWDLLLPCAAVLLALVPPFGLLGTSWAVFTVTFTRLMVDAAGRPPREPMAVVRTAAAVVAVRLTLLAGGFAALVALAGPPPPGGSCAEGLPAQLGCLAGAGAVNVATLAVLHLLRVRLAAALDLTPPPRPLTPATIGAALLLGWMALGGWTVWVAGGESRSVYGLFTALAVEVGTWVLFAFAVTRRPPG